MLVLTLDWQDHTHLEGKKKRLDKDRCPIPSLKTFQLVYRSIHSGFQRLYLRHKVHMLGLLGLPVNQCINFSRKEHIPLVPKPWYSVLSITMHIICLFFRAVGI